MLQTAVNSKWHLTTWMEESLEQSACRWKKREIMNPNADTLAVYDLNPLSVLSPALVDTASLKQPFRASSAMERHRPHSDEGKKVPKDLRRVFGINEHQI